MNLFTLHTHFKYEGNIIFYLDDEQHRRWVDDRIIPFIARIHFLRVLLSLLALFIEGVLIITLFPFLPFAFVHTVIFECLLGYFILKQKTWAIIVAFPCSFLFSLLAAGCLDIGPWNIIAIIFFFSSLLEFIVLSILGLMVLEKECSI